MQFFASTTNGCLPLQHWMPMATWIWPGRLRLGMVWSHALSQGECCDLHVERSTQNNKQLLFQTYGQTIPTPCGSISHTSRGVICNYIYILEVGGVSSPHAGQVSSSESQQAQISLSKLNQGPFGSRLLDWVQVSPSDFKLVHMSSCSEYLSEFNWVQGCSRGSDKALLPLPQFSYLVLAGFMNTCTCSFCLCV
jgi:hypothetical protein